MGAKGPAETNGERCTSSCPWFNQCVAIAALHAPNVITIQDLAPEDLIGPHPGTAEAIRGIKPLNEEAMATAAIQLPAPQQGCPRS